MPDFNDLHPIGRVVWGLILLLALAVSILLLPLGLLSWFFEDPNDRID